MPHVNDVLVAGKDPGEPQSAALFANEHLEPRNFSKQGEQFSHHVEMPCVAGAVFSNFVMDDESGVRDLPVPPGGSYEASLVAA
jgi:hypothetical protein